MRVDDGKPDTDKPLLFRRLRGAGGGPDVCVETDFVSGFLAESNSAEDQDGVPGVA